MTEEWKEVEGFSRYEISTGGIVREVKSLREIPQPFNNNFYCVNLIGDDGKKVLCKVHRLVAITYIENPENAHNVVHKDGDRSNNSVSNLFWKPRKVKEVVEKTKPISYQGVGYSYKEFANASGVAVDTLKYRISAGWSIRECFAGHKDFTGVGVQTDTHWFPTENDKIKHDALQRKVIRKQRRYTEEMRLTARRNRTRLICGVGLLDIEVSSYDPVYRRWTSLISRCYSETSLAKSPTYRDKFVCDDWLHFSNFKAWMDQQDWDGLELDKDVLVKGNKVYSSETCVFIPAYVNSSLCLATRARGDYPVGVVYHKYDQVYRSHIKSFGVRKDLGSYPTPEEAHQAWQNAKIVELENIITRYSIEPCFRTDVADSLMSRVWGLRIEIANESVTITL